MSKMKKLSALLLSLSFVSSIFALTLREAIQYSVVTSPRVLQTVKVCLANEQAYKGAVGGYFPTLDATGALGYEHSNNTSTRARVADGDSGHSTLLRREFGLEARQMLFDGLSTMSNVSRNRFKLNASAWAVSAEANEQALRVAEAYINVLRQKEMVLTAKENVKIHKKTSDMITRRSESGVSRNTDAVQAEGRLAQATSNLKSAQGHLKDAEIAFFRVSGMKANRFVTPNVKSKWLPKSERQAIDKAIEYHPSLRSANSDILEAIAQHKESKSTMMPHLDLVGAVGYNNNLDGVRGRNNDRSIMLEGRWNLLNGGRDFRRRRETAYLVQESAEIRNNAYRQIIENTKLSWISYRTNTQLIDDFKKHMDAARSTIDAYAKQFQLGQRTLLDLLNSENEFFASRTIYTNTKYDILLSKFRLISSMGVLNDKLRTDLSPLGAASHEFGDVTEYPDILDGNDKYRKSKLAKNKALKENKYATKKQKEKKRYNDSQERHKNTARDNADKVAKKNDNIKDKVIKRRIYSYHNRRNYQNRFDVKAKLNKPSKEQGDYTIQLLATGSERGAREFIKNAGLDGVANYYRSQKKNGDSWYLVTYGQYGSMRAASSAIGDLPRKMTIYKPWARTSKSMEYAELIYGNKYDDPSA